MPRTTGRRTYGKTTRTKPLRAFAELPQSPIRKQALTDDDHLLGCDFDDDSVIKQLEAQLDAIDIEDDSFTSSSSSVSEAVTHKSREGRDVIVFDENDDFVRVEAASPDSKIVVEVPALRTSIQSPLPRASPVPAIQLSQPPAPTGLTLTSPTPTEDLRVLTWHDVCPPGDTITKIAEASFAEVYRVKNTRGTSIIKCIRLDSPLKAQTKAQVRSGLVDEEPHTETDLIGELRISEWLADIPGFVVYKERYIVQGKAPKPLLETHQAFQRKMKRLDPDRLQYYPSPSRYLDGTRFLVVELGDAGVALEDFELTATSQLWDIFFLVAIALARAEDHVAFEHRDLHEGNLCIRQVSRPRTRDGPSKTGPYFGYSGLDITILDYGLSRAEEPVPFSENDSFTGDEPEIVAPDLEKDLSIFTSTHADQCKVYRQMRSFFLSGGTSRKCLPPSAHRTPYQAIKAATTTTPPTTTEPRPPAEADSADGHTVPCGPLSWAISAPYTNVLWLAYAYQYLITHFAGDPKEVKQWRRDTAELWRHLDPEAKPGTPVFGCAAEVVLFGLEAGWVGERQLMGGDGCSMVAEREHEDSIILSQDDILHEEGE